MVFQFCHTFLSRATYRPPGRYYQRRILTAQSFPPYYQTLASHSIASFTGTRYARTQNLADETKHITKFLSSHLHSRSHSNFYSGFAHSHFSNFQAKFTIKQHTNISSQLDYHQNL